MAEQEYLHTGKIPYFPTDTKRVVFLIRLVSGGHIQGDGAKTNMHDYV